MSRKPPDVLFFAEQVHDGRACLSAGEKHHAVHVLRKGVGDVLMCTDGKGSLFTGRVSEITKTEAWIAIEHAQVDKPPGYQLRMAIAPVKNFSRMEWCLEKLTEIGVHTIIPVWCHRAERQKWNSERAYKVLLSAMKQSRRVFLPECSEPLTFSELISNNVTDATCFIACMREDAVTLLSHYRRGQDVLVVIGPEGDFTEEEINTAIAAGYTPLSLGDYRLRTETAAIVAATGIQLINQ